MAASWLDDFVTYASICEASPRMMTWVGISTIAGALRRKVWIDEEIFKWTPNFYILLVGPPGVVKKSTSINIGYSMLAKIPGINFGPDSVTWQALITDMVSKHELVAVEGEMFNTACVSLAVDEFGAFYDPLNRDMTDALTHLWDTKMRPFRKMTKGQGDEVLENPYVNLISCTTPSWLASNLSESAVGGGLASRFIYVYEDGSNIKDIAYPSRAMSAEKKARAAHLKDSLQARLHDIAQLSGRYRLTEAAYKFGEDWYAKLRKTLRERGFTSIEAWFLCRQQTLLHKLAMVLSASQGDFPTIDISHLNAAQRHLDEVSTDAPRIFGYVGVAAIGKATQAILEVVEHEGPIEKRALWRKFYQRMRPHEFDEAMSGALATGYIVAAGELANPVYELQGPPRRKL